jgi:hypothetical protein
MLDSEHGEQEGSSLVYRSPKHDSLINRIQLILSLDLLLRLLSCNLLLPSDCLHCLKTSTNLFNSIILFDIFRRKYQRNTLNTLRMFVSSQRASTPSTSSSTSRQLSNMRDDKIRINKLNIYYGDRIDLKN